MWKGHTLEVHGTNIQSKRLIKWWNIYFNNFQQQQKWVWEIFRKDYSTSALFAWDKRALFGNYFDSLLSDPLLWKVLFHYLMNPFATECWCHGLLSCALIFTYQSSSFSSFFLFFFGGGGGRQYGYTLNLHVAFKYVNCIFFIIPRFWLPCRLYSSTSHIGRVWATAKESCFKK